MLEEAGIPTEEEGVSALSRPEEVEEESGPPKSRLKQMEDQLEKAINDENYELAAKLRDEIQKMNGEQAQN